MKLTTTAAPHLRTNDDVRKIMIDVFIALTPASVFAVYLFGMKALALLVACVVTAEALEFFIMRVMRGKKDFIPDGSASVTGLLLGLNLSIAVEWWQAILGVIVAVGIAKHVFGGLGKNFWNPALIGRVFLVTSFPVHMTTWLTPFDLQTTATPLMELKQAMRSEIILTGATGSGSFSLSEMFLGTIPGSMGEVSALLLLIGFAYLVIRKRIKIPVPVAFAGSVLLISWIFYIINPIYGHPLYHLLSGGLLLGALFMATDMVTSPMTLKGQLIFGCGCGGITMLIRYFGGFPEGVSFAILIMNALVPLIDIFSRRKIFGAVKSNA